MSDEQVDFKRALLARLRFERSMGMETVPVVARARAAQTPAILPPTVASSGATVSSTQAPAQRPATFTPAVSVPLQVASIPHVQDAADVETRWKNLEARAKACTACALHEARTHVVFGSGNRQAKIVFVGEGPGEQEDMQGLPFVGPSGEFLTKIITAMKLTRDDVYLCNVVKCRPPGNRPPLPDEVAACNAFLVEQLELINPKVIVALGGPAAKTLCKTSQGIMSIRGRWHAYRGIPVMPTYHPAFVLLQYTEVNRRAVWDDMKAVLDKVKQ